MSAGSADPTPEGDDLGEHVIPRRALRMRALVEVVDLAFDDSTAARYSASTSSAMAATNAAASIAPRRVSPSVDVVEPLELDGWPVMDGQDPVATADDVDDPCGRGSSAVADLVRRVDGPQDEMDVIRILRQVGLVEPVEPAAPTSAGSIASAAAAASSSLAADRPSMSIQSSWLVPRSFRPAPQRGRRRDRGRSRRTGGRACRRRRLGCQRNDREQDDDDDGQDRRRRTGGRSSRGRRRRPAALVGRPSRYLAGRQMKHRCRPPDDLPVIRQHRAGASDPRACAVDVPPRASQMDCRSSGAVPASARGADIPLLRRALQT